MLLNILWQEKKCWEPLSHIILMFLPNIKFHRFYDSENLGYIYYKFYLSNLSYFKDSYLWISVFLSILKLTRMCYFFLCGVYVFGPTACVEVRGQRGI